MIAAFRGCAAGAATHGICQQPQPHSVGSRLHSVTRGTAAKQRGRQAKEQQAQWPCSAATAVEPSGSSSSRARSGCTAERGPRPAAVRVPPGHRGWPLPCQCAILAFASLICAERVREAVPVRRYTEPSQALARHQYCHSAWVLLKRSLVCVLQARHWRHEHRVGRGALCWWWGWAAAACLHSWQPGAAAIVPRPELCSSAVDLSNGLVPANACVADAEGQR